MSCSTQNEIKYLVPTVSNRIEFGDRDTGLGGLFDTNTQTYLNAETATFEIKVRNADGSVGATITSGTGTMNYVAASNGRYVGFSSASANIVDGAKYWIFALVAGKVYDKTPAIGRAKNC